MHRTNRTSIGDRMQAQANRRSSNGNHFDQYDLRRPSVIARLLRELGPTIPLITGDPECDFILLSMQLDEEKKDGSPYANSNGGDSRSVGQAVSSDESETVGEVVLSSSSDADGKGHDSRDLALEATEARRMPTESAESSFSATEMRLGRQFGSGHSEKDCSSAGNSSESRYFSEGLTLRQSSSATAGQRRSRSPLPDVSAHPWSIEIRHRPSHDSGEFGSPSPRYAPDRETLMLQNPHSGNDPFFGSSIGYDWDEKPFLPVATKLQDQLVLSPTTSNENDQLILPAATYVPPSGIGRARGKRSVTELIAKTKMDDVDHCSWTTGKAREGQFNLSVKKRSSKRLGLEAMKSELSSAGADNAGTELNATAEAASDDANTTKSHHASSELNPFGDPSIQPVSFHSLRSPNFASETSRSINIRVSSAGPATSSIHTPLSRHNRASFPYRNTGTPTSSPLEDAAAEAATAALYQTIRGAGNLNFYLVPESHIFALASLHEGERERDRLSNALFNAELKLVDGKSEILKLKHAKLKMKEKLEGKIRVLEEEKQALAKGVQHALEQRDIFEQMWYGRLAEDRATLLAIARETMRREEENDDEEEGEEDGEEVENMESWAF